MNLSQNQSQAKVQEDGLGPDKLRDKPTEHAHSIDQPCDPSSEDCRTLHDVTENSSSPVPEKAQVTDLEKVQVNLAGKYAKYAGEPPDGGLKAWSVILGTSLTMCAAFGIANAWGIFQAYYQEVTLRHKTPSTIAWIGSVQYALVFLPGLVMGRLFDIGYFKITYFFGSCLLIICTFLVAECKEFWQFFLAQGLGVGLACGILFGPALGVVSHWFKKRRGIALGFTAIGSSVGGTIFPVAAQNLIPQIGFKWTMRIFGFILLAVLGVANITLDRRLPPQNVKGGLFNWAALKNPAYALYCVSGVINFMGLYIALVYIPISAIQVGISSDFAFYFIAIVNGSSAFGRIAAGLLSDRFGPINIMIPFLTLSATMTYAWPYVTTKSGLSAIAVIYGFASGTYVSLLPGPGIAMGPIGDVGRRTGLFLTLSAFGVLAGPPISGAIDTATGGFKDVGFYAGSMTLFSVCLLVFVRYFHLGKWWGKF